MRIYKTLTREFLSQYTDALLDLTQEKMAESLRITYRAAIWNEVSIVFPLHPSCSCCFFLKMRKSLIS